MSESYTHSLAHNFVQAMKRSEEYREYEMQLTKIKQQPDLYEKTNEFRQKNFFIQNTEDAEHLMDRMEELDREYADLRSIPLVEDFLDAETSFCRMMQEVNLLVTRELNFQ